MYRGDGPIREWDLVRMISGSWGKDEEVDVKGPKTSEKSKSSEDCDGGG